MALRDGTDGEAVLAAWVEGPADPLVLRAFLSASLPSAAVPSRFVLVEALPRLLNGKVDRAALRLPDARRTEGVPPQGPTQTTIATVLSEVMGHAVGATDDLFDLGISSLQAVQALWRLNAAFAVELPIDLLYHTRTVQGLAARIDGGVALSGEVFEVVDLAPGAEPPVFWLPPAYGLSLAYRPIVEALPGRATLALDLPQPPKIGGQPATVEALGTAALRAIRARQPQGPVTLVGWSFGGVLAYEVARQLGSDGVSCLVVLDSAAPGTDFAFGAGDAEIVAQAARRVGHMFGLPITLELDSLAGLSPQELGTHLLDALASYGLPITEELRRQLMKHVEIREGCMAAWRAYAPGTWAGPAWVVRATGSAADWTAGWDALLTGPLTRREVPGSHVGMLDEPHSSALVAVLKELLGEAPLGDAAPLRPG